jgi:acyl-CoA synthetase (AMP-forming)/AMP-acid ligase II
MFEHFARVSRARSDVLAVSDDHDQVTFSELIDAATALAPWLVAGDGPAVVWLALPGGVCFTTVQLAGLRARAVIVPMAAESTTHEATHCADLLPPDVVVVWSLRSAAALLQALDESVSVIVVSEEEVVRQPRRVLSWRRIVTEAPGKPLASRSDASHLPAGAAVVQFTSGSTGRSKGIVLTQDNLRSYLDHQHEFLSRFAGQQVFCPMPQFHSYGGTVALEYLSCGASVHMANRFLPAADVSRIQRHACSAILASPTYFRLLLQLRAMRAQTLPSLRWINIGTAAVDRALVDDLRECRPDLTIYIRYGLTETMGYVSHLEIPPGQSLPAPGLVGAPIPGMALHPGLGGNAEAREIRVRGETIAVGALVARGRCEPLVDRDGWFRTGDLGHVDRAGRLQLGGRLSTFLKRNGFRIDPAEVEAVLRAHSGVQEAVVVGVPDAVAGQRILAVVEPRQGAAVPEPQELVLHCRLQLSEFKVPQACIVATLPRTPAGKPDRPRVMSQFAPRA